MTDIEYLRKYLSEDKIEEGLEKLKHGMPVQYIVGNVDFYGINIEVNENVLIPRFETEYLVEKTIKYVKEYIGEPLKIIDLGTGSGAIAIALKKKLNAEVEAIDISDSALAIAKKNSDNNNAKIKFYKSDMLENVKSKYDLIISNPPYISKGEEVEEIVKNNEPSLALYAENEGLEFYEKILKKASNHLKRKSIVAFEIGYKQGEKIKRIAEKYINNVNVKVEKDLTGKDRYVFIFKK